MARVDHAFSDKHSMSRGCTTQSLLHRMLAGNNFFEPNVNQIQLDRKNAGLALDDVYSFSPTFVTNLRYGITYQSFPERRVSQGTDLAALGFSSNLVNQLLDKSIATVPRIQLGGYAPCQVGKSVARTPSYSHLRIPTPAVVTNLRLCDIALSLVRDRFRPTSAPIATRPSALPARSVGHRAARRLYRLGRVPAVHPAFMSRSASFALIQILGFFTTTSSASKATLNIVALRLKRRSERYNRWSLPSPAIIQPAMRRPSHYALNPIPSSHRRNSACWRLTFRRSERHRAQPIQARRTTSFTFVWLGAARKMFALRHASSTTPRRQHSRRSTACRIARRSASLDKGVTYVRPLPTPPDRADPAPARGRPF